MKKLLSETRNLFKNISDAAYANPFSQAREDLDRTIVDSTKAWPALVEDVNETIKRELKSLKSFNINEFENIDRRLIRAAVMFELFHLFGPEFDKIVKAQIQEPEKSLKIPFAEKVLIRLEKIGFTEEETLRYFSFMFQIRRAYFLISTKLNGTSPASQKLRKEVWQSIFTYDLRRYVAGMWSQMEDFSTLLLGETGTGKGVVAMIIGQCGWIPFERENQRFAWAFTQSFIAANLSEYTPTLIESALFGHKRGAFTGAVDEGVGLFERCRPHGTIFLDEIGELQSEVQVKLLRVLQERYFSPVGGHEKKRFDGRVIAATNIKHEDLQNGQFRKDFYYRVTSVIIEIPSLRTRIAENPTELKELLSSIVPQVLGRPDPETLNELLTISQKFQDYGWPGNIRELEQFVRRVLVSGTYDKESSKPDASNLEITAKQLLIQHAMKLSSRGLRTSEIARLMDVDRRTAAKYLAQGFEESS